MSGDGLRSIPDYLNNVLNISAPTVLISIDDLAKSNAALKATEVANKTSLELFDESVFMNNLHKWAGSGFQASYPVYELKVVTPVKTTSLYNCSDGTPRNVWDYIPFCMGYPITQLVDTFQRRVSGMNFSFSLEDASSIILKIHVTKQV